jgi:methenyltetrahydromethanopterin cyclohydrolase
LNKILIIANSARMLAQAARDSGFIPFVMDCYGDWDTQNLSEDYQQVKSLNIADLLPAINFFKQQHNLTQLVYGSGFEQHSDSLIFLAQHFEILGNSPETFIALQNKRNFFHHLQQLNINYPEVRFTAPNNCEGWLIKPEQSQGGLNIRWAKKPAHPTNFYYQRYIDGKSLSALFLANGKQAQIIGYNQQLVTSFEQQPFVFAAILNHAEISLVQQQTLTLWINQLTAAYGLRGLNSLDFMLADGICYVLEINPRPPASMQLYEGDLLSAHISNSIDLPGFKNLEGLNPSYKAYQILYAQKSTVITEQIRWPDGGVDIPASGAIIGTGQPICSMIASGKNLGLLLKALQLKTDFFFQQLSQHNIMQYQASVNKLTQPLVRNYWIMPTNYA